MTCVQPATEKGEEEVGGGGGGEGGVRKRDKLQALVNDILPLEDGAEKRCSECGRETVREKCVCVGGGGGDCVCVCVYVCVCGGGGGGGG